MKTAQVIRASQIRDEYIKSIEGELMQIGNQQMVDSLVQIIGHFASIIDASNIILLKIEDVIEQPQEVREQTTQNINEMPEELKPSKPQGINPAELNLKQEYERKVREMNEQINPKPQEEFEVDNYDDYDDENEDYEAPEPPKEFKKQNFMDKLRASKDD